MGSCKWGYKSPNNMGYNNSSYPTYNPTYGIPMNLQEGVVL